MQPLKIVLFGPESTGKTTLASELAKAFNTNYNPEYLRLFVDNKLQNNHLDDSELVLFEEVLQIAEGQQISEEKATQTAKNVVFFDTCLYTNFIYTQYYFGKVPSLLKRCIANVHYDFFLLCDTDIPWQADSQRDGETVQRVLFKKMQSYLIDLKLPFSLVQGKGAVRVQNAIEIVLKQFPKLASSLNE